ncbi:MAG: efflux RND transporter permease subunit [Clostridiaceae bacterium]|uniref:MMPL family transporter n=1 Tax=Clostridium porci TaxID=2605778 RepID=A0A7X2NKI5_9CLOT|nr:MULTISPECIES: efflux RND transporter permease subunit [Clostridium]MCI6140218.1 efflux RND transporter permease subunit [Clostridium sp.]MDY3231773.1 efflux RND transporter permease subunit [Clostridiaceae bacterium]MSS36366.1 MMPL family transporter [Clostridium porci]
MGQKLLSKLKGRKDRVNEQEGVRKEKISCRLARFIIHKKGWIEGVFAAGCLFSLFAMLFVNVNYDLTEYLPETAQSCIGLDLMEKEFGYPGTARVMLKDVTLYEAKQYKDKLEAVDGVDQVLWCDNIVNIYSGEDFINEKDIEDYYKDGCAVMDVTFEEGDTSQKTSQAIDEMKAITGDKGSYVGMAVQNKSLTENVESEMHLILTVAVIMIFVVLCITTNAWSEPVLFLLVMGVAILLNRGTNIFIGTVSFLTNNVAMVLQLATSMDYSIFLLDAYSREKQKGLPDEEAMVGAIDAAINSIFASSLTTVVGFMALVFMNFTIGFDMGLVLAKGIVFSLITVVFFMPAMILKFEKWNTKTRHRPFLPSFRKFSQWVYRMRYASLIILALLAPPAYVAQGMNDFLFGNSAVGASEGTQVYEDDEAIAEKFGRSNMLLALYPNTSPVAEKAMSEEIDGLPYVKSVTSLSDTLPQGIPEDFLPYSVTSQLHTEEYCRMLIYIRTKTESDQAFRCADELEGIVRKYYPDQSFLVGETPSTQDIKTTITADNARVNMLSLAGVFLVVMFSFRSLIIPVIVMIPIEVAIFLNMAIPYLMGETMVFMGYIIVSSIQLGATVDYSILLTNNYVSSRRSLSRKEACVRALMLSCPSIFTSGAIIILAGYIIHFISSTAAIGDLGHLIGRGALLSVLLVLTVLPALLVLFDRMITSNEWERLQRHVKRRRERRRVLTRTARETIARKMSGTKTAKEHKESAEVSSDEI